jgi:predicted transposase YdaD
VMRENLESPGVSLLDYFFPGERVKASPMPPRIRQHITEQETDTLVLIESAGREPFIFHLEFQSSNDPNIAARMASYDFMLYLKYRMDVVGVVIYIGEKPMRMKNAVSFNGNHYSCRMIDIRDMDPFLFLSSDRSGEIVLGILAGRDEKSRRLMIKKILMRLRKLLYKEQTVLRDRIKDLEILSSLRGKEIQQLIIKEEENMPIIIDLRKDLRFQQGKKENSLSVAKEMIKDGMDMASVRKYTGISLRELKKLPIADDKQNKAG